MEITTTVEGSVCVVALRGKFDTASSAEAETELMGSLDAGAERLLLDFSDVAYIASSGLRVLLKLAQRLKAEGGQLRLCSVNENVSEVLRISGFDTILDVFADRRSALDDYPG